MAETMIERATQALMQEITKTCAVTGGMCARGPDQMLRVEATFNPDDVVRAVLTAMREPTPAMLDAGMDAEENLHTNEPAGEVWSAMIDAALKEEG